MLRRVSLENWTKDHKSGKVTKVTKIKPASFMKGKAHIEIFDKQGNLEQEAVTENVITTNVNRKFTGMLLEHLLCYAQATRTLHSAFGRLIANNYASAEDADIAYFPDMLTYPTIAWCHKSNDYGGADSLRGDINKEESDFSTAATPNSGELTIVMDWDTDQGNGTFQSLFWISDVNVPADDTDAGFYPIRVADAYNSAQAFYGQIAFYDNDYYTASAGKVYAVPLALFHASVSMGIYYNNSLAAPTEVYDYSVDASSPSVYDSVLYDGTYFYVYCPTDNALYKYNAAWALQGSITITYTTYMNAHAAITTDGTYIYTTKRVDATNINIYKFDMAGSLQATYNMYTDYGADFTPTGITFDGTNIIVIMTGAGIQGTILIYSTSGTLVSCLHCNVDWDSPSASYTFSYDPDKEMLWVSSSSSLAYGYLMTNFRPNAHTLLASPVTKTNINTMKITYTFSFDLTAL